MIDKSLSQYQQNLLEGTTLGALRRAGIVDAPIQRNVARDPIKPIAMQTPKNINLPESKTIVPEKTSFQPAAKIKAASPVANLIKQSPGGAGIGSFDPKRSEALAKDFYDQATAEKDSYLDKHISDFLDRSKDQDIADDPGGFNYLPSSLATIGGDFAQNLSGTTPLASLALSLPSEGEGNSYSDTQIQNIYESGDSDTKNLLTNAVDTVNDIFKEKDTWGIGDILKIGGRSFAQNKVSNLVSAELGLTGAAAGGPLGMLIGWLTGKLIDKFIPGGAAEKKITPPWAISLTGQGSKEDKIKATTLSGKKVDVGSDEWMEDMDLRDKEFEETGDYDVYSDTGTSTRTYSPPDPSTYTYEGSDEQDEASNYETPAPVSVSVPAHIGPSNEGGGSGGPTGPTSQSESDYGYGSDAGWWAKGGRVKLTKGGRVDKALTGRSRDI